MDERGAPNPPRIVSLVPSLTELLCALGLRDELVGRTGFCIHPRELLREVPKVGGTKDVKLERVRELAPTHLVVNVDENEKPTVDAIARFVPEIVVTHPIEVEDNRALIERFGELFDRRERAAELAADFSAALAALRGRRFEPLPVVYLIWKDPWMTVGPETFIARMLAEAGMHALSPPTSEARYPTIDLGWMRDCGACAILLSSEPYRFRERHARELAGALAGAGAGDPTPGDSASGDSASGDSAPDNSARGDFAYAAGDSGSEGAAPLPLCVGIDGEMTSWYGSRATAGLRYLLAYRENLDRLLAGAPGAAGSCKRSTPP